MSIPGPAPGIFPKPKPALTKLKREVDIEALSSKLAEAVRLGVMHARLINRVPRLESYIRETLLQEIEEQS